MNANESFISTVINAITSALSKCVAIFKKHGFIYSMLVMLLLILFYTLIVNPIRVDRIVEKRFEMMYEQQQKKEAETITRRLKADDIIGGIMVKIVDKFPEVKRILLLESHNSIKTISGELDILYFSATMEMLTSNSRHLNYIADDLQKQIRYNLMGGILNTLKYRDYLYYDAVQNCTHESHRLIQKLKTVGDKEALIIPYKDANNIVQIVLVITGDNLPVEDITDYVADFRKQIEDALM